jgi:hypothetical protein
MMTSKILGLKIPVEVMRKKSLQLFQKMLLGTNQMGMSKKLLQETLKFLIIRVTVHTGQASAVLIVLIVKKDLINIIQNLTVTITNQDLVPEVAPRIEDHILLTVNMNEDIQEDIHILQKVNMRNPENTHVHGDQGHIQGHTVGHGQGLVVTIGTEVHHILAVQMILIMNEADHPEGEGLPVLIPATEVDLTHEIERDIEDIGVIQDLEHIPGVGQGHTADLGVGQDLGQGLDLVIVIGLMTGFLREDQKLGDC